MSYVEADKVAESIFEEFPELLDADYVELYNFPTCPTTMDRKGMIHRIDVAAAIIRFEGNLTRVAAAVGRARRVIDSFITRDLLLSDLLEDIQLSFIDAAEEKVRTIAKLGDTGMLRFILSTLGKNRGYNTRMEVTGKDGENVSVNFFLPENGRDNVDS